jgi:hypothetical protein
MDLKDATLVFLTESAGHPSVASLAQTAYDQLAEGDVVPYQLLSDMIGEASGAGILRVLHGKYSATACNAVLMPVLQEIDRQKPVPPRRRPAGNDETDPLTAPRDTWS